MKRFVLCFMFSLILLSAYSSNSHAAGEPSPWAKKAVEKSINSGILPYDLQNSYTNEISRKDFCKLIARNYSLEKGYSSVDELIAGELKNEFNLYSYPFKDVDKNSKDSKYIFVANILGFVNGVAADSFSPNSELTREQAAKILLPLYLKLNPEINLQSDVQPFNDDKDVAIWAKDDVYKIKKLGIMNGMGDNKFSPKGTYTREQSVISVLNLNLAYEKNLAKTDMNSEEPSSQKADNTTAKEEVDPNRNHKNEMLRLVNIEREKVGVAPLKHCEKLDQYTDIRAKELVKRPDHTRPDGSSCFSGINFNYAFVGENLAAGFSTAELAMNALMNSPGHKKNILSTSFEELSIGYYQKDGTDWGTYWIQIFYTP